MEIQPVYDEWIEATKAQRLRWHEAQALLEEIKQKRALQARQVAARLLNGISPTRKTVCPTCGGSETVIWCSVCKLDGVTNA